MNAACLWETLGEAQIYVKRHSRKLSREDAMTYEDCWDKHFPLNKSPTLSPPHQSLHQALIESPQHLQPQAQRFRVLHVDTRVVQDSEFPRVRGLLPRSGGFGRRQTDLRPLPV